LTSLPAVHEFNPAPFHKTKPSTRIGTTIAQGFAISIGHRKGTTMYTRLLVPLDGSKTAETVLPYARFLAARLRLPVEILHVVDVAELGRRVPPDKAEFLNDILANAMHRTEDYLKSVATTFRDIPISCTVEKGAQRQS
jgi:hypothetical protein